MANSMRYLCRSLFLSLTLLLVSSAAALAATPLEVDLHDAYYLDAGDDITRVVVGDSNIADVKPVSSSELMVFGQSEGSTSLVVCGNSAALRNCSSRYSTWNWWLGSIQPV